MTYRDNAGPPDDKHRLEELLVAISHEPSNAAIRADVALLQVKVGDLDAAQRNLRALLLSSLDATPLTKADVFHQLAIVAERRGERDKAIAMAERALEADPGHIAARELVAALGR
jgi:tetratricopeptide (TPR) repeat protein